MEPLTATPEQPVPAPPPQPAPSPAAATPSPQPAPAPAVPPGSGVTGAPGLTTPAAGTQTPPPADPRIAEYERQIAQYRQYEHLIPLGYQQWQTLQKQPQPGTPAAAPAQPANPFGLPAFDHNLLNFVARDPNTGRLVLEPGAPPDAVAQVQAYQEKLRAVQQQFWSDPGKFLQPMIQDQAKQIAQQIVQQHLGGYQQQTAVNQIVQQNSDWLFERDPQTQQVRTEFDPATGKHRQTLSPAGRQYATFAAEGQRLGIQDPQAQHDFALAKLQNLLFQAQLKQQQAGATGQQAGQQFVNQAAANAQAAAAANPAAQVTPPPPPAEMSLKDRLKLRFQSEGLTDAVLQQQINRQLVA